MNITSNRLTATAGLCAAAAGAIFIGVQINHPPADVAHIVTTEMTIRESAKVLMTVLALAGLPACSSATTAASASSGSPASRC
jgi:hypothetical protein